MYFCENEILILCMIYGICELPDEILIIIYKKGFLLNNKIIHKAIIFSEFFLQFFPVDIISLYFIVTIFLVEFLIPHS